jgi:hypothetical protein
VARFKTGERMQWGEYRKFLNDLCLSQGTRARAKTGGRGKETGKLGDFFARHGAQNPPVDPVTQYARDVDSSGALVAGRAVRLACAGTCAISSARDAGVSLSCSNPSASRTCSSSSTNS